MKNNWRMLAAGLFLALLAACAIQISSTVQPVETGPLPTSLSLFFAGDGRSVPEPGSGLAGKVQLVNGAPTVSGLFLARPEHTPIPSATREPSLTPSPQPSSTPAPTLTAPPSPTSAPQQPAQVSADPPAEVFIFDDELNPNWLVYEPSGMAFDLQAAGPAYTGRYAIEAVPETAASTLLFAVRPYPQEHYNRREVLALSFRLYHADGFLGASDLSAAVLGSNSFYSYVNNDVSVHPEGARAFTLTPLDDLAEGAGAPEGGWVEVTLWLDDLPQDPEYRFVTGFYLKNLSSSGQPLRIDEVRLILAGGN